jgi:hypothetical protein
LRKAQLVQRGADPLAESVNALRHSDYIDLLLRLRLDLAHLPGETVLGLREFLPFALEFLMTDDFSQVNIE